MKEFSISIDLEDGEDFRNIVQSALGNLDLDHLNELPVDAYITLIENVRVSRHS